MTKKQAISLARKLANTRMNKTWFVVYDIDYEDRYGKDEAWAVCDQYDLATFYAIETPIYCTKD